MIDDSKNKTPTDIILEHFESSRRKQAELEARKSPEQKALEKRQAEEKRQAQLKTKAEKTSKKLTQLYSTWCKRDTWLVYKEALYLFVGQDPAETTVFDFINNGIWELARSCAGHSLNLANPKDKDTLWRVTPAEWARWLKEKGYAVPAELTAILSPITPIVTPEQKIAPAQQAREKKKRDRIQALKAFVIEIGERARKNKIEFDKQSIPVTKGDFLKVFHSQYPQIEEISLSTFDHDIAEIGLKFKPGTKPNKNNILVELFK